MFQSIETVYQQINPFAVNISARRKAIEILAHAAARHIHVKTHIIQECYLELTVDWERERQLCRQREALHAEMCRKAQVVQ